MCYYVLNKYFRRATNSLNAGVVASQSAGVVAVVASSSSLRALNSPRQPPPPDCVYQFSIFFVTVFKSSPSACWSLRMAAILVSVGACAWRQCLEVRQQLIADALNILL